MLPSRMHDSIDRELERDLRCVGHVLGISKDAATGGGVVNQPGFPGDVKLVASGLRLRKALQSVPAVPQQIGPLRRGWGDEHTQAVVREDGTHRVEARGAVPPDGGEEGQPDLELKEQRAADICQVGLGRGELLPRHHRITSRRTDVLTGTPHCCGGVGR